MTKQEEINYLILPVLLPHFGSCEWNKKALTKWRDKEGFAMARLCAKKSGYKVEGIEFDKWCGSKLMGYTHVTFKIAVRVKND